MTPLQIITALIVLLTYAAIAIGKVPLLRMNRATIALLGAVLLVVVGAISEEDALHAIDVGTILLLAAMMVINVHLRLAGFFGVITARTLRWARTPGMLLALVIGSSGILSALFLNDPICLLMTPLVVDITRRLGRNIEPYLIGLGAAANIGSVATITGNPQNLIIGQASGISYLRFAAVLTPVALIGLVIAWVVIVLLYREEFRGTLPAIEFPAPRAYNPLLNRVLIVTVGLLIAFLIGIPVVTAACAAAGLLLVSRIRPEKLLRLDWDLLAFFAGLFVVTGALETSGLSRILFNVTAPVLRSGVPAFTGVVAALSNVVSNVPAVLLLRPEIPSFPNPEQAWLTLAMASTLAGNLTLLGSAATLIVAEVARQHGARLSFMPFLRAGIPITLLTLLVGILWLMVVFP
jgi:Na+/H+ antiporter NhaD/arsenite permease-like protein